MAESNLPQWFADLPKITGYAEIDEVLRSKDFVQGTHQEGREFLGGALLLIDGDEHFARRRLESPLFSRAALAYYEHHALEPVVGEAFEELRGRRGDDGAVRAELVELTRTMLYRIAAVTTGIDGVEGDERTAQFITMVNLLGDASTVQWSTRPHHEVIAEGVACREEFVRLFYGPSLARRQALVDAGTPAAELPRDLLTTLLLTRDPSWDDGLLLREATLYLIAATRTTMHAVPDAVHHLHGWLAAHPEDSARLDDPAFLRAVAAEALRLHPPSPALVRTATVDVTLSTGRRVAAGERIALLFGPANRDRAVFGDDADEFDPHRRVADDRVKGWGLSFGGGEHLCIGRSLVTGTGAGARTDEQPTEGTMTAILHALVRAGARPDPAAAPQRVTTSLYEAYATYPILLTAL